MSKIPRPIPKRIPPTPDRRPIFSLVARNRKAKEVVEHHRNKHLLYNFQDPDYLDDHLLGIGIGFHNNSQRKTPTTVAEIGRGADVHIDDLRVSRTQCAIEINEQSHQFVLYDRSRCDTTHTYGRKSLDFPEKGQRQVLLAPDFNDHLWISLDNNSDIGKGDGLAFKIYWHKDEVDIEADIVAALSALTLVQEDPLHMRTVEAGPPPRKPLPRHASPDLTCRIPYLRRKQLGCGTFGAVFKALHKQTGDFFAVKMLHLPDHAKTPRSREKLSREVKLLAGLVHPNIVDFIGASWHGEFLEIYTAFYDGSVENLVASGVFKGDRKLEDLLFRQVLEGLVYVAIKDMIHRDIKPDNILYSGNPSSGKINFRVADLGGGNYVSVARTGVGSPIFMAPELLPNGSNKQTSKMDVWSFGATMVYVLNLAGFQDDESGPQDHEQAVQFIRRLRNANQLGRYGPMLIEDIESRASAADMLVTLTGAEGSKAPPAKAPQADASRADTPPPDAPRADANAPPTNALRANRNAAAAFGGRPIKMQKLAHRPGVGLGAPPKRHCNAKDRHYKDTTRKLLYGDGVSRTRLRTPRRR